MSASNWAVCPGCTARNRAEAQALLKESEHPIPGMAELADELLGDDGA